MGFEDTLMNFLLEPEAMEELLDYITDYKLTYAQILVEKSASGRGAVPR